MRILLVEDDELLGDGVEAGLKQAGYAVDWVRDGTAAELALRNGGHDAVILDLGLPRKSGLDVLSQARRAGNRIPVLILTARDTVDDRIRGLDAGADDYLVKPFDLHELTARVRALIRRAHDAPAPVLRIAGIELDPAARTVRYEGQLLDLPAREFGLLHALLLSAGRVLTREQLGDALYGWGEEIESNAIDVHIHHLRRKLAPDVIRTVRGVGYMIARD
jgi:DNA-binding response OmpR family regulator